MSPTDQTTASLPSISHPNPTEEHPKSTRVKIGRSSHPTQTQALQSDPTQAPKDSPANGPFLPGYFFFYGHLMDPSTLARALQQPEAPDLRPARVLGYSIKMHGRDDPALVWGPPENVVDGVAGEIRSQEQFERICGFGCEKFEASPCYIEFVEEEGEGEVVKGETFLWQGDHGELRD
ncbi:hypothetical protein N7535_003753 [Penicillium sp. DV-2018c]|nr:hypothetical protein N7461_000548 [Penicillium sp. DV-2018c]KAJ5576827.1 hypothetical protein N7535_003753 [Penicillium sp. DV-2018c]